MPLSLYLFSSQHNVGRHEARGNGKQLHGMAEKFHNLACNLVFNTFLRLQPQHRFGGVLHLHVLEGQRTENSAKPRRNHGTDVVGIVVAAVENLLHPSVKPSEIRKSNEKRSAGLYQIHMAAYTSAVSSKCSMKPIEKTRSYCFSDLKAKKSLSIYSTSPLLKPLLSSRPSIIFGST